LAGQADPPTLRDKLLDLARIWMQAAIDEKATVNIRNRSAIGLMLRADEVTE
jgi:hypothetical protein